MFSPSDTIVALATAPAPAGIGVVRISGPRSLAIARAMLSLPHDLKPRHATLTRVVVSPSARAIDEVVATYFPTPHSYTSEDVVEISAHGSLELLREIVKGAMDAGARLAEPGEFTLRAFLNGRLDLVQAEAVGDLVNAVTPLQARVAFDQLEGTLTRAIGALDAELFDLVARLEASVDFPDEGYHFADPREVGATLARVRDGVDRLLATASRGRLIREGRLIAILGKPNVGKSSLFNLLVGTDRAIVTATPGTTRDLLRETVDFEGIRLGLVDTAGIRRTEDEVEQEGVTRARRAGDIADLVLLVLDRSRPLEDEDLALLNETSGLRRVVIANKSDLGAAWAPAALPGPAGLVAGAGPVEVSLKTGAGMDTLRRVMRETLDLGVGESLRDTPAVTNLRHVTLLEQARASLDRAMAGVRGRDPQSDLLARDSAATPLEGHAGSDVHGSSNVPVSEELVIADVADARHAFEEVTGRRTSEDLLRHIFGKFCIGK